MREASGARDRDPPQRTPEGDAPDASRSRQAPVRTSGGTSIQPVVADSGESPTPSAGSAPSREP